MSYVCCMPVNLTLSIAHTNKKELFAVSTSESSFFCSFRREKLLSMTLNNYGSIFVKIDRNVLMSNEFSASAFDSEQKRSQKRIIRNEFNVLKILSKHTQIEAQKMYRHK